MEEEEVEYYKYGIILDPAIAQLVDRPQVGMTIPIRVVVDNVPDYVASFKVEFFSTRRMSPQEVLLKFKGTIGIMNIIWEDYD